MGSGSSRNFPATANAVQTAHKGKGDANVVKLTPRRGRPIFLVMLRLQFGFDEFPGLGEGGIYAGDVLAAGLGEFGTALLGFRDFEGG